LSQKEIIYVPTIKRVKITKSIKEVRGKQYSQYTLTIPKEFGSKAEENDLSEMVITANDIILAIPTKLLQSSDEEKIKTEVTTILKWLKQHSSSPFIKKKRRKTKHG
jgi:hypothetical protein